MDMVEAYVTHLSRTSRSGSKATCKARGKTLRKLQRDLPFGLDRTCEGELEDWIHNGRSVFTGEPWSHNTKANYVTTIRDAYAFWSDPADPWIDENPAANIPAIQPMKGRAKPGREDHLTHIIEHGREPYRTWTIIAAYQGLRCCELSGLDREHITEHQLVVVRGKGGYPRAHDTDPLVWEVTRDLPPGPVCRQIGHPDRRAGEHYISQMARTYFQDELGFTGLTMHMWRHRLGVQVQRLYKNARVTMEMLGQRTLSATQIYTAADFDEMREARSMLPRPAGRQA
jgi:integrase/recombinase XerC